ncbi:hypothetical protein EV356DRAFT_16249 [Viridothelium virens]|uniref:C2H2-type domain-containing protein n=1 Tax=Viridothelium virens TaxID=1048519 RepID=A0A6A6HHB6_VIRVR|nr:hypothetical protein EV356DRAFT_16249 [Viridothelium virens]
MSHESPVYRRPEQLRRAQTSNARIRRPPRNRSLTTPTRLLLEQQLQHAVSEASAASAATPQGTSAATFSWDPSLTVSQAQSLESQPVPPQAWSLSAGNPQSSGVDVPTFSVETAPPVFEGSESGARSLGFDDQLNTEDMSSLGFVIPQQQYTGLEPYPSNFENSNYNMQPHPYGRSPSASQPQSPPSNYRPSYGLSPALLGSTPSHSNVQNAQRATDRVSPRMESPAYRSTSLGPSNAYNMQQSPVPGGHRGLTYPTGSNDVATSGASVRSGLPTHYLPEQGTSSYDSHYARSPQYMGGYTPGQQQAQPGSMQYLPSLSQSFQPPYMAAGTGEASAAGPTSAQGPVRVINSRPKPQCWEHGCNGRQFSTFSNLLRHQREKSGTAAKSYCPKCGAEFTRTTARNGHLAHEKCSKQRKSSEGAS